MSEKSFGRYKAAVSNRFREFRLRRVLTLLSKGLYSSPFLLGCIFFIALDAFVAFEMWQSYRPYLIPLIIMLGLPAIFLGNSAFWDGVLCV